MGTNASKTKRTKLGNAVTPIVEELLQKLEANEYQDYLLSVTIIDPRTSKAPVLCVSHSFMFD